jgi:hypothetical protein
MQEAVAVLVLVAQVLTMAVLVAQEAEVLVGVAIVMQVAQ